MRCLVLSDTNGGSCPSPSFIESGPSTAEGVLRGFSPSETGVVEWEIVLGMVCGLGVLGHRPIRGGLAFLPLPDCLGGLPLCPREGAAIALQCCRGLVDVVPGLQPLARLPVERGAEGITGLTAPAFGGLHSPQTGARPVHRIAVATQRRQRPSPISQGLYSHLSAIAEARDGRGKAVVAVVGLRSAEGLNLGRTQLLQRAVDPRRCIP